MIEFIAEFAQVNSLPEAIAQAQAAKKMGATHAKWQIFDPARLAGPEAKRYWGKELGGSESQREMFDRLGCLSKDDWATVSDACKTLGIKFMATPFDLEAVDLLESIGVSAYKVASGDITYRQLIRKIAVSGKRVYLSTGAADRVEIAQALAWLGSSSVTVMACDLVYPCLPKDAQLAKQIRELKLAHDGGAIGYSDHTKEVVTGAVAVALGATVLEKHVTTNKQRGNPDDRMALTVDEATEYVKLARQADAMLANVSGDPQAPAREGARRSAHAARDLEVGEELSEIDVVWLRPCPPDSIPADAKVAGKITRPVVAGQRITTAHLAD